MAKKRPRHCKLPSPGNIAGRSSSITNAFFNALIPIHSPTIEEEIEALRLLEMDPAAIACIYCGDVSTEWDHLRPIITNQKPTGYITEIANLVPACGKCNQSKGKQHWKTWMLSAAQRSPATRQIADLARRVALLDRYERWKVPVRVDIEKTVSAELWSKHCTNWRNVLDLLKKSQSLAEEIKLVIEREHRQAGSA